MGPPNIIEQALAATQAAAGGLFLVRIFGIAAMIREW